MTLDARCSAAVLVAGVLVATPAWADPKAADAVTVTVSPEQVRPGDPVLVTVLGSAASPKGKVGKKPLAFFAVRDGHQAVFAVPVDRKPGELRIELGAGLPAQVVSVIEHQFPAADVTVPDEYANPSPEARKQIDEDNRAIRSRSESRPARRSSREVSSSRSRAGGPHLRSASSEPSTEPRRASTSGST